MKREFWNRGAAVLVAMTLAAPLWAQHDHPQDQSGHDMQGMQDMPGMPGMEGMDHSMHSMHEMHALLGPYPMTRAASGTSWQPDSAPHTGLHQMAGPWELMLHGYATVLYDHQDGPRGDTKTFSENMLMGM